MTYKLAKYIFFLGVVALLNACAQINPLQGGDKDSYAPRVDSVGTFPLNGQTNFTGDEVVIKFSEYIALNNASENILITPQLATKPEYRVRNKKLTITFAEPLAENTTYTLSFNRAITDITEKNDSIFQFVFSTGDYIDSLSITGNLKSAFTNKPEEGYLVALFSANTETPPDSIPFLDMPLYITQSDEQGGFNMNYLKEGAYYVFAIQDLNKNLKLDPAENRAFWPAGEIYLGNNNPFLSLLAFSPEVAEVKLVQTKFEYPGKVTFIFKNNPIDFSVHTSMDLYQENTGKADSVVFWLAENPTPKMHFFISLNEQLDTLKPLYKGAPKGNADVSLTITNNLVDKKLLPKDSLKLYASEPIANIVEGGIHCFSKDSTELPQIAYQLVNVRTIQFDSLPKEVSFMRLDSGSVVSRYGHSNQQVTYLPLEVLAESYFGTLILNIDSTFQIPVYVQLLNDKNELIQEKAFLSQLIFNDLIPGKYQIRLVLDENADGKWTTGSLEERRMPEKTIYNKELIDIKSNWEKEVDWNIKK